MKVYRTGVCLGAALLTLSFAGYVRAQEKKEQAQAGGAGQARGGQAGSEKG